MPEMVGFRIVGMFSDAFSGLVHSSFSASVYLGALGVTPCLCFLRSCEYGFLGSAILIALL